MANVTIKTPSGGTVSMPEEAFKRYQESQGGLQGVDAPSRPISSGGGRPMPTGEFGMSGAETQTARLDQVRQNALTENQKRTRWVMDTIQQRRENPVTYGGGISVPTNRFGEPIKAWTDMLGKQGRLDGTSATPLTAPSSASTDSVLASTGFGAMQRAQQASTPQPLGRSPLFAGMGYTSSFGGGPQPAQPMMSYNNKEDTRTRFRRTLGLV